MNFELFEKYRQSNQYEKFSILKDIIDSFEITTLKFFIGSDKNIVSEYDGNTILHQACYSGCLECVKLILKFGLVGINQRDTLFRTPLHMAVLFGHDSIVQYLLEMGAHRDSVLKTGETALSLAKSRKNDKIINLLTEL